MKKTGNCVHLRIRWLLKMWLAMRFLMFFLLLSVVPVSASVFGQDAKVSLQVEKASLEKVRAFWRNPRITGLFTKTVRWNPWVI